MAPLMQTVPDGQLNFSDNGGGRDVQLYLTGDDPVLLEATAHKAACGNAGAEELRSARIRGDLPRPEIIVHPRLDIAAQLGVSVESSVKRSALRRSGICRRTAPSSR
jgi:multidrug efflux pump subunit AcrB